MPALWDGYALAPADLQFWAEEIATAAQELDEGDRESFLRIACSGSDALLRRARDLLVTAWELAPAVPSLGRCRPGDTVGDCLILRRIGGGGSGEVFKAIQRSVRRLVAVKVVAGGSDAQHGLAREAANTARLLHPNIATVYSADLDGATPCIVMEYVDAISLRAWLERHYETHTEPPSEAFTQSVVGQVAAALAEAHRRGLSHRDIKPENVLLAKRGTDYHIKVVDFGIARSVDAPHAVVAGTPGYIAPELLAGAPSDARADIFSLGVVLFELLTGRHPFRAPSDAETHLNTLRREPEPAADASNGRLPAIARRALQKSPADRYRTIDAFIADLEAAETDCAATIPNPLLSEFPDAVRRWCDRHSAGFLPAVVSCAWGCASFVLSIVAGAACVRIRWAASGSAGYEMIYGYAVEPNAGPWYVVGASVCVLFSAAFLEAAHRGLVGAPLVMASNDAGSSGGDPVAALVTQNRRYFRFITPAIVAVAVGFVAIPEIAFRLNHAFGWVQADLAAWYVGSSYDDLRAAGRIGDLSPLAAACADCRLTVAAATNRTAGFVPPPRLLFDAFLFAALGHQVALTALLMWLGAKIIFFFGFLSTALLGHSRHGVRLKLDFQDRDDYRFGLGQLDSAYYAIVGLIAVGSIGLFLQAAANVSKGTYFLTGDPTPALFGQAALLISTVALLAILLITPACVFLFLTIKAVNAELARLSSLRRHLEQQLTLARSAAEREQIRSELDTVHVQRDTARRQSLLPIRRPAFLVLLSAACLMLIALPFAIGWLGSSSASGRRPTRVADTLCALCGNAAPPATRDRGARGR